VKHNPGPGKYYCYYRRKEERSAHPNQCFFLLLQMTEEEKHTSQDQCFFVIQKKEDEKHKPGPGEYYCY
jgi:hypothetical protein